MIYPNESPLIQFLIAAQRRLQERTFLIDLLTVTAEYVYVNPGTHPINSETLNVSNTTLTTTDGQTRAYELYDIIHLGYSRGVGTGSYYVSEVQEDGTPLTLTLLRYSRSRSEPLITIRDGFTLTKNMIANYKGDPVVTSVGRYIANFNLLVIPFVDKYPYINTPFNLDQIGDTVASMILRDVVDITAYKRFIDQMYFIGHFGELCVPTFSEKSFTTDPNVPKRKKELLAQYKDQLGDPNIMTLIEDELIAMDKAYLKGDSSERFLKPLGSKAFDIHRKKMFLTIGGIDAFKKGTGDYDFIPRSLAEGWDPRNLPVICNEIRKGSHNRGVETQNSGAQTKSLARVLQDLQITAEDCGAVRGLTVNFGKVDIKDFFGRNIMTSNGLVLLTKENQLPYLNKVVMIRSPMYCKTHDGLCKACMGRIFTQINANSLNFYAVTITSSLMNLAMKAMHGTKLEMVDINPMAHFVPYPTQTP